MARQGRTYSVNLPGNLCRNTAEGSEIFLGGEVITLSKVGILERGLAFGVKVGGGARSVKLRVLARGVT